MRSELKRELVKCPSLEFYSLSVTVVSFQTMCFQAGKPVLICSSHIEQETSCPWIDVCTVLFESCCYVFLSMQSKLASFSSSFSPRYIFKQFSSPFVFCYIAWAVEK